jgi:hypothetical protein
LPLHTRIRHAPQRVTRMPALSIVTPLAHQQDKARSRLRENIRQAKLAGAPTQQLAALIEKVITRELSFEQANDMVLAIRRGQRQAA